MPELSYSALCQSDYVEPQQRAHSPWLAAGLASESKLERIPYGRRFLVACCEVLQFAKIVAMILV